jgi:hypothetical protein
MAAITPTIVDVPFKGEANHVKVYTWTPLTNANIEGVPVSFAKAENISGQLTGTFGAGGTFQWQGSNDNVTFFNLLNWQGVAISRTANALDTFEDRPLYIKPKLTAGGDGTTSVTAILLISAP